MSGYNKELTNKCKPITNNHYNWNYDRLRVESAVILDGCNTSWSEEGIVYIIVWLHR